MIHYTPMPMELVFEGYETFSPRYYEVAFPNGKVIVEPVGDRQCRVVRLISHNSQDYLDPRFQPGTLIDLAPKDW